MIEWLSEASQVVNAFAVVVLAAITAYYAWTTKKILEESKKMREAAEKQAESARSQASVAFGTLRHLRQQMQDVQHLGYSIIGLTIDKLVRSIDDWRRRDIRNKYAIAGAFPLADDLVTRDEQEILGYARRISGGLAELLNGAFSDLRSAQGEINTLIRSHSLASRAQFDPLKYDPDPHLTSAFEKLLAARDELEKNSP